MLNTPPKERYDFFLSLSLLIYLRRRTSAAMICGALWRRKSFLSSKNRSLAVNDTASNKFLFSRRPSSSPIQFIIDRNYRLMTLSKNFEIAFKNRIFFHKIVFPFGGSIVQKCWAYDKTLGNWNSLPKRKNRELSVRTLTWNELEYELDFIGLVYKYNNEYIRTRYSASKITLYKYLW